MKTAIRVHIGMADSKEDGAVIWLLEPLPVTMTREGDMAMMNHEAEQIFETLRNTLPGGTFGQLRELFSK
jgi:hypothetical protein